MNANSAPGPMPPANPASQTDPGRMGRLALWTGVAVHLLFVISLKTHWIDPYFAEAVTSHGQAGDYFGIYQAGDNLLNGLSIYDSEDYRDEADRRVPYFYFYRYLPPTAFVAAVGAKAFDPWTAYWIWVGITELLLVGMVVSLLRTPLGNARTRWILGGIALGFTPFYIEQWMGQFSVLMAVLLWIVLRSESLQPGQTEGDVRVESDSHREGWRRLLTEPNLWAWASSIALKTFSALFALAYLRVGRVRRVLTAAAIAIAVSLPYYLARPSDLLHFLHLNLRPLPPTVSSSRYGLISAVQAASQRILGSVGAETVQIGPKAIYVSSLPVYAIYLALFAAGLWMTWRFSRRGNLPEFLSMWILTFFLVFKDIWEYHHVMLLPVGIILALRSGSRVPVLVLLLLALPTFYGWIPTDVRTPYVSEWPLNWMILHGLSMAAPTFALYLWTARRCLSLSGAKP